MKKLLIIAAIFVINTGSAYNQHVKTKQLPDENTDSMSGNPVKGTWIKIGPAGPISLTFSEQGLAEGDFGNDQSVDVVDKYEIHHDTIGFTDKEGQMCEGTGQYKLYQTGYYLAFDLIDDLCGGRIQTLMGYWTRPDYKTFLDDLDEKINRSPEPELYLYRARIYLAVGEQKPARADFDAYLKTDSTNARVYINRAGTRFPDDLEGVVCDCSKAIALEPDNKNAWFLRGLARYALGKQEQACEDFTRAIELGFSVLKIAEQDRCAEYWKEHE